MNAHLLTRDEILDAIARVHDFDTYPPADPTPTDGTYRIIPSWVGNARVWMAQKLSQEPGYEIGFAEVAEGPFWYPLGEARFGYWRDPETGIEHLDQTVNVRGNLMVAEAVGKLYNQKAIWDWSTGRVWNLETV